MGYIQDQKHFVNYLNRAIRDMAFPITKEDVFPASFYVEHIYDKSLADAFCWDIKQEGAGLLERDRVLAWLKENSFSQRIVKPDFKQAFTKELLDLCEDLANASGVYCFCTEDQRVLYVGMSVHLGERILTSFKRLNSFDRPVFMRYIESGTCSDAAMLELYFIGKMKPPLNASDKYQDDLTLELSPIPDWSKPVLCNIILRKDSEDG